MFRLLLYLSAVFALPGAAALRTENASEFNISSCPIVFYGQMYDQLYVNLTSENTAICFNGFYDPQSRGDCLLGPKVEQVDFEVYERSSMLEEEIQENLPNIRSSMNCYVYFELWRNDSVAHLSVGSFGRQAALKLNPFLNETVAVDVIVNNNFMDTVTVTNPSDDVYDAAYVDLSGCRHSGLVYKPGSVVSSVPEICSSFICSQTAVLQNTTCGPLNSCQGNGSCLLDSICTVTGPAVIDFYGQLDFIRDRCGYSLLETTSLSNFQLLARFQERRRRDVSFLDSVKLTVNNVNIHLEQGGRVQVDHTPLDLSSPQTVTDGVKVSKDQTGVTVIVQINHLQITVFFDGYTAQILVEGSTGSSFQGLCENSSSEPRVSAFSPMSCRTQYNDTGDSSINCTNMTERCNLLRQAPFTSCSIDPQPYITACTDTLCRYPAVDGLKCQFLTAYTKACSLYSNTTVGGWRSKANCPSPQAFCQNRTCSDHEFCGEKNDCGETRCFCRPIFASSYRETNTLGNPTLCRQNTASISLVGCLLEDIDIDYSTLHLNDPTCRGQLDERTHLVTFSFRSSRCGTEIMMNNSQIIYQNTISNQNNSSDMILNYELVNIDFSCYLNQPGIKSLAIEYQDVMDPGSYNSSMDSSGSQLITRLEQSQENITTQANL